ncbi:CASP-like protein 2D1 [Malania oleifera]|uniref:CASP-like protein 2D1 n=1 Tax=Malania oleifera TaxID=397392 RepID=UPI0025AE5874|nr:CASP-like protein 2D1 [Malania oleifera]
MNNMRQRQSTVGVGENENAPTSVYHLIPTLKLLDFALRLCAVPLSVASIWVTVTNQQDNSSYGKLQFSTLGGLKYMVCINALSAAYALFAALSSWFRCLLTKAWVFFVSDQVVAYLMVTSGAAVLEILYLAYNGDREASWSEACNSYGRFCVRVKLGLALHASSLCCFLLVSVISAYRTFSTYPPPSIPSEVLEDQRN